MPFFRRRNVARFPASRRTGGRTGRHTGARKSGSGLLSPIMIMAPLAAFAAVFLWGGGPSGQAAEPLMARGASELERDRASDRDRESASFAKCVGPVRQTCVVDGDTFWYRGTKIRIADINTPETGQPACPAEAQLGADATRRLTQLLNDGPFSLESADRDTDRYGRALRIVTRGGDSLGAVLVAEGLAEAWQGKRGTWC